ncbi:hypothetical protein [Pontixanthobacter sp. CEM42]|uniref:hypothetical protein n=1 Tax=Pontixanthobacter sp. CEM42 TaxID=2792077 RepID=UPI001AE0D2D4|nr:hypothetical protein [Pontixanthobacter sp. CEM42]
MFKAIQSCLTIAALFAMASPLAAQRQAPAKTDESSTAAEASADMPWHNKTEKDRRFTFRAPYGDLASTRHLKANFDWYAASDDLSEKPGMFNSYHMYIGVTKEGRHEGIIYDVSVAGAVKPEIAVSLLNKISGLTLSAEGGEGLLVDLSDVKSATIPSKKDPSKTDKVHFRTFSFPQKSYRMMGALPEENRMRFLYRKPDGKVGYFGYHSRYNGDDPWAYSIGYAKELSQGALKAAQQ